jgi:hypothetical protein
MNKFLIKKDITKIFPKETLSIINDLNSGNYLCFLCKIKVEKTEIYSCKNCYKIYHLSCVSSKLMNFDEKENFFQIKYVCCNNIENLKEKPKYNCFCGKFYKAEKSKHKDFNQHLIPHACGMNCEKIICEEHKFNCNYPCHPNNHQECDKCGDKKENSLSINNNINDNKTVTNQINGFMLGKIYEKYVINLKGGQKKFGVSCENYEDVVYCGRQNFMGGWKLNKSIWHNPFKVADKETNESACKKYEDYLRNSKDLLDKLPTLAGKRLGCWCYPNQCHTMIIIKLMIEKGLIKE